MAGERKVNWFAIWVSVAVVVALVAVAVLVAVLNNPSSDAGDVPDSPGINSETGAIAVGNGDQTLDTYIDFMCPICNQFEQSYGPEIEKLIDDGTITLNIHPISILDRASQGTKFSTRSAAAAYCVAEENPDASLAFMQAMFQNQPEEGSTGLTDDQIIQIASGVGVTGIDACVNDGKYTDFVTSMTPNTPIQPGQSGIATPTIAVNGEVQSNQELPAPDQFATLFD